MDIRQIETYRLDCNSSDETRQRLIDAEYIEWTQKVIKWFLFYGPLIIMPTGILFNSFMIVIFLRKAFHKATMGFYYIVREYSCVFSNKYSNFFFNSNFFI